MFVELGSPGTKLYIAAYIASGLGSDSSNLRALRASVVSLRFASGRMARLNHDVPRNPAADAAHLVGAQAALVPHHVWHCVGRGIAVAAGGTGRGLPLGQPARAELAGRGHH